MQIKNLNHLHITTQSECFNDISSFVQGLCFLILTPSVEEMFPKMLLQKRIPSLFKYNLYNFTTMFGNINYSKTSNPVVNRAFFCRDQ
jgi:hypothetical protein